MDTSHLSILNRLWDMESPDQALPALQRKYAWLIREHQSCIDEGYDGPTVIDLVSRALKLKWSQPLGDYGLAGTPKRNIPELRDFISALGHERPVNNGRSPWRPRDVYLGDADFWDTLIGGKNMIRSFSRIRELHERWNELVSEGNRDEQKKYLKQTCGFQFWHMPGVISEFGGNLYNQLWVYGMEESEMKLLSLYADPQSKAEIFTTYGLKGGSVFLK